VKNDADAPRPRSRREIAALGLFLVVVALSAWRFYRVRNYVEFVDESAETTAGWLVSEGASLYGSVFSHHMPLAVAVSHVVASLSPTDHPAHFRAAPWLGYVLLALAVAFGPIGRRSAAAGPAAGAAFLVLASLLAPLVWAHLALNDVFWGLAFATFLVLLPLPLLFDEAPRAVDTFIAGAAASLSLAGSPVALMPLAFGLLLAALAMPGSVIPSRAGAFLAGSGVAAACVGTWLWRFADLGGFLEEGFRFNEHVYARFLGNANTPAGVLKEAAMGWGAYVFHAIRDAVEGSLAALLVPPVLAVTALVAFAALRRPRRGQGRWRAIALVSLFCLLVFSLRIRGGDFRAIPLYVAICATATLLPCAAGFRRPRLVAGIVVLAFVPVLAAAARHESLRFHEDTRQAAEGAWWHVARYVETHASPDERIASYPIMPIVYLESHRRPATDSVFFLPWQAAWEEENPTRSSTCAQLRARPPRYVALQPGKIWGYFPWETYAACIDRFLKDEYEPVEDQELGGLLLRRKSTPPHVRD
jgi:hypothetical protein